MELSKRLLTAANMVEANAKVIDVASDHGLLGLWLLEQQRINKLLLTDINPKALENAKNNALKLDLKPDFLVTDGLDNIKLKDYNTIIISGLGAKTIINILESKTIDINHIIILVPHTNPELIRKYMVKRGFKILDEKMVYEKGRYYFISKYQLNPTKYNKLEIYFSPFYKSFDQKLYIKYLKTELTKTNKLFKQIPFKYLNKKIKYFLKQRLIKKMLFK